MREVLVEEALLDLNLLYAGFNKEGYLEALVLNEGNYAVQELEFFQRDGAGPWYREMLFERIEPGESAEFVFASSPAKPSGDGFICVAVNDGQQPEREIDLSDNEQCFALAVEELSILHAWPIPFDAWINVALVSPIRSKIHFGLYAVSGAEVFAFEAQAEEGYNRYRLDITGLEKGTYILKAEIANGIAVEYLFGGR